jgi:fibronectin-binding autotransporter adhesin
MQRPIPHMRLLALGVLLSAVFSPLHAQPVFSEGDVVPIQDPNPSTTWDLGGTSLTVGNSDAGVLTIGNGGLVQNAAAVLGNLLGGDGSVTVTGGTWNSAGNVTVGDFGVGSLGIGAGGLVSVSGTVFVGASVGSSGVVSLSSGSSVLSANRIVRGAGSGSLTFDGGILRARSDESDFLSGFQSGEISIGSGGAAVDTNGHSIGISSSLGGTGGLEKVGSGTLTLSGSNTYSGTTRISGGTLVVASDKALGDFHSPFDVVVSGASSVLQVNSGVTLNKVVRVGDAASLINRGLITAPTAVFAGGGSMNVLNTGTVASLDGAAVSNYSSSSLNYLTNDGGLITSEYGIAVDFYNGGSVVNQNGGRIQSNSTTVVISTGTYHSLTNTGSSSIVGETGVYFVAGNIVNSAGSEIVASEFTAVTIAPGSWLVMSSTLINSGSSRISGREYGVEVSNEQITSVSSTVINTGGSIIQSATTSGGVAGVQMTGWRGTVVNDVDSAILGRRWGVRMANGGVVTNSGVISGSFAANAANAGVSFAGASGTLTNSGTINGGVMMGNFANTATLNIGSLINGSLNMGTSNTTKLFLAGAAGTQLYSNAVTGITSFSGTIIKQGAGAWILDRDFTTSRAVTISAGLLQIGNGGTVGSVTGNVANSGTLAFHRSNAYTYSGTVSGAGQVFQLGTGTTILTGNNTYTGGTTISAGTLQLGAGGLTGTVAGNILNNGALVINRSNAFSLSGAISGTGRVAHLGTGTTTFTNVHTYSGATIVNAGSLLVDGELTASVVTVKDGATLGGSGSVFGAIVESGGSLSPGNSPGALNFTGDLTLMTGSVTAVEIQSASVFDEIHVGGLLSYGGVLEITLLGGYAPGLGEEFTLFTSGLHAGAFTSIVFDTAGYEGAVDYSTGKLTITAVPEPAACLLTAMGLAVLACRRRRKSETVGCRRAMSA